LGQKASGRIPGVGIDPIAVDQNEDNLRSCAEKYGVRTEKDYRKILQDNNIKAVSICTPNETHYRIAKDFLNAKKNVMVEKPLAMTIEQGRN